MFVRVLSVPLLGGVRGGFMVPTHAQSERGPSKNRKIVGLHSNNLRKPGSWSQCMRKLEPAHELGGHNPRVKLCAKDVTAGTGIVPDDRNADLRRLLFSRPVTHGVVPEAGAPPEGPRSLRLRQPLPCFWSAGSQSKSAKSFWQRGTGRLSSVP